LSIKAECILVYKYIIVSKSIKSKKKQYQSIVKKCIYSIIYQSNCNVKIKKAKNVLLYIKTHNK